MKDPCGSAPAKIWTCLSTCLTVWAIHLECVYNMVLSFLRVLHRFFKRRRMPSQILWDSTAQFRRAHETLHRAWQQAAQGPSLQAHCVSAVIAWNSPWLGLRGKAEYTNTLSD